VPCYNEAERLVSTKFLELASATGSLLFVDDGSTDSTPAILEEIANRDPDRISVLALGRNVGKGEAVRRGLLEVLQGDVDAVGFLDADLATPVSEFGRLCEILSGRPDLDAVIGARVGLAGHDILRRRSRHYIGRLYATGASLVLARVVYDTQCGAKVFRTSPSLRRALAEPFSDRWSFDVELLGRLLADGESTLLEVPLEQWSEVPGSKLGLRESLLATWSLVSVWRRLRRGPSPFV
jgi:glycosyltransferase involved in cell wall biosynthesis